MTNFKGTKGKWGYDVDENNFSIDLVLPNDTVISHSRDCRYSGVFVIERDEMNANMKLISKAPEMLGMLEKLYSIFRELNVGPLANEIENLIKEATEL